MKNTENVWGQNAKSMRRHTMIHDLQDERPEYKMREMEDQNS